MKAKTSHKRSRRLVNIRRAADELGSLLLYRCDFTEQMTSRKAARDLAYLMRLAIKAP